MKQHRLHPFAGALVALALVGSSAWAQTSAPSSAGPSVSSGGGAPTAQPGAGTRNTPASKDGALARGDRNFMVKAAEGGLFEVQAGQLAASKATDPAVKSYASMLVEHHTAANDELTQLAKAKGVELPAAPPRAMLRDIEQLGKLSGAQFDQRYVREVGLKDHQDDIKLFQKRSKDAKDAQLKAWIDKTLPTLQQHLAQAQKLPQAGKSSATKC